MKAFLNTLLGVDRNINPFEGAINEFKRSVVVANMLYHNKGQISIICIPEYLCSPHNIVFFIESISRANSKILLGVYSKEKMRVYRADSVSESLINKDEI